MYTKRVLEEALWLRPYFRWTLQDVVDLVVTFCKKNRLSWSYGRARKQIADGLRCMSNQTHQRGGGGVGDSALLIHSHTTLPLTCKSDQIIESQNQSGGSASSPSLANSLAVEISSTSRDTFASNSTVRLAEKVSRSFPHKSKARDNILQTVEQYRGWVKSSTVATKAGISLAAAKKQLQRLSRAGFVDGDGGGRYRKHRDRKQRKLKLCSSKPIPRCRDTGQERKSLTRGELKKRGWHENLIDRLFPKPGKDYKEKEFALSEWSGQIVKTRIYPVSRIKAFELEPWFEIERAEILRWVPR